MKLLQNKLFSDTLMLVAVVVACSFLNCGNDKNDAAAHRNPLDPAALPNSPILVVRQWQISIDENRAEEAKLLSTERTKKFIDESPKFPDEPVVTTIFSDMICREVGDRATCVYFTTTSSDTTRILDSLTLLRENGQWKIDIDENSDEDVEIFDDHEPEPRAEADSQPTAPPKKKK